MRRLLASLVTLVILLCLAAPAAFAADSPASGGTVMQVGRVVVSIDGPVAVPSGQQLDTLVVLNGDATIAGGVSHLVLVNGNATTAGATIGSLTVVNGTATVGDGTTVTGDVSTVNGTVVQAPGATIVSPVRDMRAALAAFSIALIPLFLLFMLGGAILAIVVGLFVAAIAGRQVRSVESLVSREPGPVLLAGLVGSIALPLVAFLLCLTVIGAPVGLTMLFVLLPAMAFLGWFVAAVWLGDRIVERMRGSIEPERPYLASVVGIVTLAFLGILPFVSLVATLFGFGAVVLATWRVLRGGSVATGPAGVTGGPATPAGPGGGSDGWGGQPASEGWATTPQGVSAAPVPAAPDPAWPAVPPAGTSWQAASARPDAPSPTPA